jgi:site-specific DNA-cytosine methylase
MKYIEFCAGGGGMRAGLDAAGWQCVLAVDNDPDAVAVHRLAHGDAHQADVTELSIKDLPQADAWVAGFPCQPFSSSGNRLGFGHRSGNVFEHMARLMAERRPPVVILENVEGLLTNKSGHTLAVILSQLTALGYSVSWLLLNLQWFGVPQTRARLFIVATQPGSIRLTEFVQPDRLLPRIVVPRINAFADLLATMNVSWIERCHGNLNTAEASLRPAVGKERSTGKHIFGPLGNCEHDLFYSFDISRKIPEIEFSSLGELVAPNFKNQSMIRSIRFWTTDSGRGPTKLWLRPEPISHCIGTSLGGAPLYAVPLRFVKKASDRAAFLEFANWNREQDGLLVMRLRPNRAVMLFGPHTEALHQAVTDWNVGDTRKYKVVGNMVAPVCAKTVAELINQQWIAATPVKKSAVNGKRNGRKKS